MNDFTKEELNMMADGIVLIKEKCVMGDMTRDRLDRLDEKLCSMINDYHKCIDLEDSGGWLARADLNE